MNNNSPIKIMNMMLKLEELKQDYNPNIGKGWEIIVSVKTKHKVTRFCYALYVNPDQNLNIADFVNDLLFFDDMRKAKYEDLNVRFNKYFKLYLHSVIGKLDSNIDINQLLLLFSYVMFIRYMKFSKDLSVNIRFNSARKKFENLSI